MVEPIDLDDGPFDPYAPTDPDMAVEPEVPKKSKRVEPPPLKRLWKSPEPEEEELESRPKKKRSRQADEAPAEKVAATVKPKKKKKAEPAVDVAAGAGKLAETPVLDTYESRQRARWAISGLIGAIGVFSLIMIVRSFRSGENEVVEEHPEPNLVAAPVPPVASGEKEARALLDNAKQADRIKKTTVAIELLRKLIRFYPGTPSCKAAQEAIDRDRRGFPLFVAEGSPVASGPKPPPETGPVPPPTSASPPSSAAAPPIVANPTGPAPPKMGEPNAPAPPKVTENTGPTGVETGKGVYSAITKPIPNGFRPKPGTTVHKSGWPTQIVGDRDGSVMVLVPGGSFSMGRADGEENERPAHAVDMTTYYIDEHEVTVRQYALFAKETRRPPVASKLELSDDYPRTGVSQRDAIAYNDWAKKKLPTEAQWEFAARSYDGRISYWPGELPRKDPAKGPRPMEKVMSLPSDRSPYGAFDLAANAWEWTADWYDSRFYGGIRGVSLNPTGVSKSPAKPEKAVVKGGSKDGILTWREGVEIQKRESYIGFRGVLSVEAPIPTANPANPAAGGNKPDGNQPF